MKCRCKHDPIPTRTPAGQPALWTPADTQALLVEFERLFRSRTPPQPDDIYSFPIETRVPWSEMHSWALSVLGKELPRDYDLSRGAIMPLAQQIMRKVIQEQSPDEIANLQRALKWMNKGHPKRRS